MWTHYHDVIKKNIHLRHAKKIISQICQIKLGRVGDFDIFLLFPEMSNPIPTQGFQKRFYQTLLEILRSIFADDPASLQHLRQAILASNKDKFILQKTHLEELWEKLQGEYCLEGITLLVSAKNLKLATKGKTWEEIKKFLNQQVRIPDQSFVDVAREIVPVSYYGLFHLKK